MYSTQLVETDLIFEMQCVKFALFVPSLHGVYALG